MIRLAGMLLILAGCASDTDCASLQCMKERARAEYARSCYSETYEELREEVMAGFYHGGDIHAACNQLARERIR